MDSNMMNNGQYQQPQQVYVQQPVQPVIPPEYQPISMWGYFGYQLLFAIPCVGLVFLIIFSFSNSNINRRNFARSYFCVLILSLIIAAIIVALGGGITALAMMGGY